MAAFSCLPILFNQWAAFVCSAAFCLLDHKWFHETNRAKSYHNKAFNHTYIYSIRHIVHLQEPSIALVKSVVLVPRPSRPHMGTCSHTHSLHSVCTTHAHSLQYSYFLTRHHPPAIDLCSTWVISPTLATIPGRDVGNPLHRSLCDQMNISPGTHEVRSKMD